METFRDRPGRATATGRGRILGDAGRKDANPGSQDWQLTRALQAFEFAAIGRSMRSIAAELGVSVGTVHADIERVRADLRTQTIEFAAGQRDIDLELISELIQRWAPLALACSPRTQWGESEDPMREVSSRP